MDLMKANSIISFYGGIEACSSIMKSFQCSSLSKEDKARIGKNLCVGTIFKAVKLKSLEVNS